VESCIRNKYYSIYTILSTPNFNPIW